MRPFKRDYRACVEAEAPHPQYGWVDLNASFGGSASPVLVEEANDALCLNALVLEEAHALGFDLNILFLDNDNDNDLNSFVSIFLCHHTCSMLPLDMI